MVEKDNLFNTSMGCRMSGGAMAVGEGVRIREVMSSPVITVDEEATVEEAAKVMTKHKIGSVIVAAKDGRPIGIVTNDDIVRRLVSKNLRPSDVRVKGIMSHPLLMIEPEATIQEAAERMTRHDVKRLAVMDPDRLQLVGVVSAADITRMAPMVFTIASEYLKLRETDEELKPPPLAGYCEECGEWSDLLEEISGKFICKDCKADLYREV